MNLLQWLRAQWAKVTFYYGWPSETTEFVSGLAADVPGCTLATWQRTHWWVWVVATVLPHLLSYLYERFVDPNGFSWKDIAERERGIAAGLLAYGVLMAVVMLL